jgi:hypothetical protein
MLVIIDHYFCPYMQKYLQLNKRNLSQWKTLMHNLSRK